MDTSFCRTLPDCIPAHIGKARLSPGKYLKLEVEIAKHIGRIKKLLSGGDVDENDVENAYETHFIFNQYNVHTLVFVGEIEVNYDDVVSGGDFMTMLVLLSGGRDAKIEVPLLVFFEQEPQLPHPTCTG